MIVTPSTDAQLMATNLTGNPAVIVPNGLRGDDAPKPPAIDDGDHDDIGGPGTPVSLTFLGGLYQDAKLAAFARLISRRRGSTSCIRSWIGKSAGCRVQMKYVRGTRLVNVRAWRPARQPVWRPALQLRAGAAASYRTGSIDLCRSSLAHVRTKGSGTSKMRSDLAGMPG
jgi:hypothetical protein